MPNMLITTIVEQRSSSFDVEDFISIFKNVSRRLGEDPYMDVAKIGGFAKTGPVSRDSRNLYMDGHPLTELDNDTGRIRLVPDIDYLKMNHLRSDLPPSQAGDVVALLLRYARDAVTGDKDDLKELENYIDLLDSWKPDIIEQIRHPLP